MSAKIPNDHFLLYGFAGVPSDLQQALGVVRQRARGCPELRLRVEDRSFLTYPAWVLGDVDARQFVVHDLDDDSWSGCPVAVGRLADDQLDAGAMTWRLHVFTAVDGVPGAAGAGTVAVLQAAHALGDGIRSSALAALMFGRASVVPAVAAPPVFRGAALPWRTFKAARAHRQLLRDTATGLVPPQAESRPVLRTNARPAGPQCPHGHPTPLPAARADGKHRCAGRGVHRVVGPFTRARRRPGDAGRRGADGESQCPPDA